MISPTIIHIYYEKIKYCAVFIFIQIFTQTKGWNIILTGSKIL